MPNVELTKSYTRLKRNSTGPKPLLQPSEHPQASSSTNLVSLSSTAEGSPVKSLHVWFRSRAQLPLHWKSVADHYWRALRKEGKAKQNEAKGGNGTTAHCGALHSLSGMRTVYALVTDYRRAGQLEIKGAQS